MSYAFLSIPHTIISHELTRGWFSLACEPFALLRILRIFPVDLLILILIVIVLQRRTPDFFADGFGYPHPSPLPVGEGTNRSFSLWGENPAPHQSISSNTQVSPSSWGNNFFSHTLRPATLFAHSANASLVVAASPIAPRWSKRMSRQARYFSTG